MRPRLLRGVFKMVPGAAEVVESRCKSFSGVGLYFAASFELFVQTSAVFLIFDFLTFLVRFDLFLQI